MKSATWQWILVAMLAGLALYFALQPRTPSLLRALELTPLNAEAKEVKLDDLRGQVVLINFWGTWCPPCVQEFPHIVEVAKQYQGRKDFRLLSISSQGRGEMEDVPQLRADVEAFQKARGFALPVYADPQGATRAGLADVVSPGVFPATFLVDRDGRVIEGVLGYDPQTFDRLKLQLATLLEQPARK